MQFDIGDAVRELQVQRAEIQALRTEAQERQERLQKSVGMAGLGVWLILILLINQLFC